MKIKFPKEYYLEKIFSFVCKNIYGALRFDNRQLLLLIKIVLNKFHENMQFENATKCLLNPLVF